MPPGKEVKTTFVELFRTLTDALKERATREMQMTTGTLPDGEAWTNEYPYEKCLELVGEAETFLAKYVDENAGSKEPSV